MQGYVKFVDVTKCIGCRACMVACKNWNNLDIAMEEFNGTVQSHKNVTANTWNVVTFKEMEDETGKLQWLFRHAACLHCNPADCLTSCKFNAIYYSASGAVVINEDKCIGCSLCVRKCKFNIMQIETSFNELGKKVRKAKKCTLCDERISVGMRPACATVCTMDAIAYEKEEIVLEEINKRLLEVKDKYPNATIYQPPVEGTTKCIYLLAEHPKYYDLPT